MTSWLPKMSHEFKTVIIPIFLDWELQNLFVKLFVAIFKHCNSLQLIVSHVEGNVTEILVVDIKFVFMLFDDFR